MFKVNVIFQLLETKDKEREKRESKTKEINLVLSSLRAQ